MNLRRYAYTAALSLCFIGMATGENALQPQVGDAEASQQKVRQNAPAMSANSPRAQCIASCEAANGQCNSEVRRERADCSKQAATGGNNPFTGRPDGKDYYCGYFSGDHCGFGASRGLCSQRFARRYAECVEWTRGNIASRRYDCIRAENKAQSLCRAELQDCKRTCQ